MSAEETYSHPDSCPSADALLRRRDGYCDPQEARDVDRHLAECARCRADYESTDLLVLDMLCLEADREALSQFAPDRAHATVCKGLSGDRLRAIAHSAAPPADPTVTAHLSDCAYCRQRLLRTS